MLTLFDDDGRIGLMKERISKTKMIADALREDAVSGTFPNQP